jgi:hypothetical protein
MIVPSPSYQRHRHAFCEGSGSPAPPMRSTPRSGEQVSAGPKSICAAIKKRRSTRSKGGTRTRPKSGYWSSAAIKGRYDAKG